MHFVYLCISINEALLKLNSNNMSVAGFKVDKVSIYNY